MHPAAYSQSFISFIPELPPQTSIRRPSIVLLPSLPTISKTIEDNRDPGRLSLPHKAACESGPALARRTIDQKHNNTGVGELEAV